MTQSQEKTVSTSIKNLPIQIIEARCLGAPYISRRKQQIYGVAGDIIGEASIMPSIYIQDKIAQMREASSLTLAQRYERLKKAAQIFQHETLAGLEPYAFIAMVSKVTGLQSSIITNSLKNISLSLCQMREILYAATPTNAVWEINDLKVSHGCSFFSRRGDVVAVITAGNGSGIHGFWPQAIAMGYRTLVKPSFREPFTAQRLVYALELAGLAEYVALIPTDHPGTETLISQSDLAIVYGGSDIAAKYSNNPRVLVQGPGRTKIIVGKDVSYEEAAETVVQSILSLGGAACVSASAILVEENHIEFAKKLRDALQEFSKNDCVTLGSLKEANAYQNLLQHDGIPWKYDDSNSRGCYLKPHVTVVEHALDPRVQRELPFPCVTIAPFNHQNDCYKALSGSLVVTILSHQKNIIDKVLSDASIANVYIGNIPTTWMDFRVPHDGYLADFLMRNRGIRVDDRWLNFLE